MRDNKYAHASINGGHGEGRNPRGRCYCMTVRTSKVYLKGKFPINIGSPSEQIQGTEKKTY
jgi:hypothetical protein